MTELIEKSVRSPLLSPATPSGCSELPSTAPNAGIEVPTTKQMAFCIEDATALKNLAAPHIEKRTICVADLRLLDKYTMKQLVDRASLENFNER